MNLTPNLTKVKHILDYIHSYPEIDQKKVFGFTFIKSVEVDASMEDWLWLLPRLEHHLEKKFFKPWYLPVSDEFSDTLIDLSDDKLPLFGAHYWCVEEYAWFKTTFTDEINHLILDLDRGEKALKKYKDRNWKELMKYPASRQSNYIQD